MRRQLIVWLFFQLLFANILSAQHDMTMGNDSIKKRVGVLIYDMVLPIDFVPSMEIFRAVNQFKDYSVFTVGEKKDSLFTMFGDYIKPTYSFVSCPKLDVLIIPGGDWIHILDHKDLINFLIDQYKKGVIIYSVCTGAYVLAKAGMLDNIKSTSIHLQLNILRKLAPKTIVDSNASYVDAGQIITAAGAATGIDAALHIIERLSGKDKADWVSKSYLDYKDRKQ